MNNLYKEMVRKPGDLCFEVSLESDKGLTMTDLSFALKFFVYGHPKNVCIHKDDLEVVEGKYYAVLNEHGFVNGVLFCEAEIVETINGINRIVSVRSNTGYMIGNCCQPSVDVSSCAHGYSLSLYKVEYVPQPIDPNPEEDQLIAEELFGEKLSLPELTADRAIADEHGNRIADTYETRQAVRNHIRAVYNEQFIENPPLILDEYITPGMLSEGVKDMLSQAGATITNVPDGEDLTTKQGVLKLSDKTYNPGAYSGLGRVYLRKNLVGGQNLLTQAMVSKPNTIYILQYDYTLDSKTITIPEGCVLSYEGGSIRDGHINYTDTLIEGKESLNNVTEAGASIHHDNEERKLNGQGMDCIILKKTPYLTQNMVSKPNTIYIIRYNYDLNGAEITIPEGCVLDFQGGSLNNGTIKGDNTFIQASLIKIFGLDIELIGDWNIVESYPEWFGAKGDGISDDYNAINKSLTTLLKDGGKLKLSNKTYCLSKSLDLKKAYNITIEGSNDTSCTPWNYQTTLKAIAPMKYMINCVDISSELIPSDIGKAITLKYLFINCNNYAITGVSCRYMMYLYRIAVRYALQDGILLTPQTYPVYIEHCYSQYNGRHGIYAMAPFSTVYGVKNTELQANKGYGMLIECGVGVALENVLIQANEQGGLRIRQVETPIPSKPAYLWNILISNVYTEANGTLPTDDENYDDNCAIKITGLSNDPTKYAGKISTITIINSIFNKSSVGLHSIIEGTAGIKLINNFNLDKIDDSKNIPVYDHEYHQYCNAIDLSKASQEYSPMGGKIIFPQKPLFSSNPYALDVYVESDITLNIGNYSYNIQDISIPNAVYTRIGDLISIKGKIAWDKKSETLADTHDAVIRQMPYYIKKGDIDTYYSGDVIIKTNGIVINCIALAYEESKYFTLVKRDDLNKLMCSELGDSGEVYFNLRYKAKDLDII